MNRKRKKRIIRSAVVVRSSQTRVKPSAKKSTEKVTFQTAVGTVKECVLNICEKLCHVAKRFVLFIGTFWPVVFDRIGYSFGVVLRLSTYGFITIGQIILSFVKRVFYKLKTTVLIFIEDLKTLKGMSLKQLVTWPRDTVRVFLKRTQKSRKDIADSIKAFKMPTREQLAAFAAEAFNKTKQEASNEFLKIVTRESKTGDKMYRAKKRLFSASCSVAVCLFVLILGAYSFGWFSNTKDVGLHGISLKMPNADIYVNYVTYGYDLDTREATTRRSRDAKDLTISDYVFNTHDVIFTSLNQYTSTVLRLEISGARITPDAGGVVKIIMHRNTSAASNLSELDAYVGHILCFRATTTAAQGNSLYSGTANDIWTSCKTFFENTSNPWQDVGFTHKMGANSYKVEQTVTFEVSYNAADVDPVTHTIQVFLYMDYDEVLTVDFEHSLELGDMDTVSGVIYLTNDLYDIRVIQD